MQIKVQNIIGPHKSQATITKAKTSV